MSFCLVFPPTAPSSQIKGGHLYRLCRPELTKQSSKPLCSDSFSAFFIENKHEEEKILNELTKNLEDEIIPQVAKSLDNSYETRSIDLNSDHCQDIRSLLIAIHRKVKKSSKGKKKMKY